MAHGEPLSDLPSASGPLRASEPGEQQQLELKYGVGEIGVLLSVGFISVLCVAEILEI